MGGDVLLHLILAAIAGLCALVAIGKMIQELTLPARMRRRYGVQRQQRDRVEA